MAPSHGGLRAVMALAALALLSGGVYLLARDAHAAPRP